MNVFVADPHWGWWIVFYFFLGGIAAGAYFMATLIDLFGNDRDRDLARLGYWIAFPLVGFCGVLLILDLDRPLRFWHMLFKSEVVAAALAEGWPWSGTGWSLMLHAPLMKYWSPMSVGSWALLLFGCCSMLSLLGSLWPQGRLHRVLRRGPLGTALAILGALAGFFVAAYTGALLTATNQPIWSDSVWIAPLFLTSAASTGIAVMIVFARYHGLVSTDSLDRLERADLWALGLELVVFAIFLASLGPFLMDVLQTWHGKLLVAGTLILGLVLPLAIHLRLGLSGGRAAGIAAGLVLTGGFLLRYGVLATPPEIFRAGSSPPARFGPEDGRLRGDGVGADPGNRPAELHPRSKVFEAD